MRIIKFFIIPMVGGLLGGAVSVFLLTGLISEKAPTPSVTLPQLRRQTSLAEEGVELARKLPTTLKIFRAPAAAELLDPLDAVGVGVALTADGLIAASLSASRKGQRLFATSAEGTAFDLEAIKDKPGSVFSDPASGFIFFKAALKDKALPPLRPVALAPFEEVQIGRLLMAVSGSGELSFHRVLKTSARLAVLEPVSSEDALPEFLVDGALEEGALLFDSAGQFFGISRKNGQAESAEQLGNLLRSYLKEGRAVLSALGVHFVDLSQLIPRRAGLPSWGLLLKGAKGRPAVLPGSSAFLAGLRSGDVLTSFDGRRLDGTLPFAVLLGRYPPGAQVALEVIREGKTEKVEVVLGGE